MKVPGNESSTYGTSIPGNESSLVRKFQLPESAPSKSGCNFIAHPLTEVSHGRWDINECPYNGCDSSVL